MFELTANTETGARLVLLAESLADEMATRAALHDREASFPHASIDALKRAGYFTAPIPAEHGGLGVTSVHDVVVASSRLARGDASVAIGVNMHLVILLNIVRRWQVAVAAADERRATAFGASMQAVARDGVVIAAAISELGQDLTRPRTTATRTPSGWRIDGRKSFCTGSPAATVFYASVTSVDDEGVERYGYAQVPTDAAGVDIEGDWDALGMRASGSHSVTFSGVEIPRSALLGGFVAGDGDAYMERNLVAGLFHASASLGIAESAARWPPAASRMGTPVACSPRTWSSSAPAGRRSRVPRRWSTTPARTSWRSSPRRRRRRRSSTRPQPGSSIAPSRSREARATSTATRWHGPTATSAPAASCTRSEPTAPTTCSATSRSGASSSCTERHNPTDTGEATDVHV
jgi:hypothetical protein